MLYKKFSVLVSQVVLKANTPPFFNSFIINFCNFKKLFSLIWVRILCFKEQRLNESSVEDEEKSRRLLAMTQEQETLQENFSLLRYLKFTFF